MKEMRNAIRKHFEDAWNKETTVVIDNQNTPANVGEFVRFSVQQSTTEQAAMNTGVKAVRTNGNLIFECFVKAGDGTGRMDTLVEKLIDAFQLQTLSGTNWCVRFRTVLLNQIGQPNGQQKYQFNVIVPFVADER